MQLAMWTYEGPPHVGAMRIATAMDGLHYVLHAPQGDTYADLLFTMIERQGKRPPVTYTTFQARDLGSDTAYLFQKAARDAYERFKPQAVLVGASCTAELLQDDPGGLAASSDLPVPVVPVELPAYQKRENWGASETLLKLARTFAGRRSDAKSNSKSCNLLGATALGFRHRDDVVELTNLLAALDVEVNVTAPLNCTPADLAQLPNADFNVVMYPEVALSTAQWMKRQYGIPFTKVVPIGVGATRDFISEVASLAGVDADHLLASDISQLPWYSRSVDSNYLTGKRVFVFADATHAIAAARICTEELGFKLVGLGTYSREFSKEIREEAERRGLEALITDDHMEVEEAIELLRPELVLGTQMERHIAKRFGIGCAVISSPVHVQDFPARYSPQMGFEGANVIFDTWVHPLTMGLEEHLLTMFREDFEFGDDQVPSHLASEGETRSEDAPADVSTRSEIQLSWQNDAEQELKKVPFFVRGKARRNTEKFAAEHGLSTITLETLYDAKAHYSR